MIFSRRLFFARPNTKSTRFSSHQVSKLSRQKPPSPRKMIRTFGHRADLRDDPGHLLHAAGRRVDVRGPQLRQQQVLAAEDVQRQIAIALVIAVEESARLLAVNRIVGGIQVEHDLCRRLWLKLQKGLDEPGREVVLPRDDLLVAALEAGRAGVSSSRLSVLLPASGLPRSRGSTRSAPVTSRLPTSVARSGSVRS